MSLDNIQLPAASIQDFFSKSLVVLNPEKSAAGSKQASAAKEAINLFGKNGQGVLVLVDYADAVHLPDQDLELLLNILSACKLSMDDTAVINLHTHPRLTYQQISEALQAKVILLLGPPPAAIDLPLSFPLCQVQQYGGMTLLWSASLDVMRTDKTAKAQLWKCLQQIFNL